ncbi:MAG: NUDIX domain-containing protein [Christensenellaceae bacterium]|nr:NUDIX domain-containing protein [Christensenellaceae bacterium]
MSKDWLFMGDGYICDLRAVGVLIKDDMILVQRDKGGTEYALPGGHVRIGETTVDGLIREYKEETGADIKCRRLLWIEECFWNWNGRDAHNIAFYYLIDLCESSDISIGAEFVSHKDNCNVLIGWIPIKKLVDIIIYPDFIKREIYNLSSSPKHFVTKA